MVYIRLELSKIGEGIVWTIAFLPENMGRVRENGHAAEKRCEVAAGTLTRKGRFVRVVVIVPVASKRMSIMLPPQEGARA